MNSSITINRQIHRQWQVTEGGRVVGRGDATRRPDGRTFVSIDAWDDVVFDQLAAAMTADLPAPLHTLVDESEPGATAGWERAGFTTGRREWLLVVPTGPDAVLPPPGVTIVAAAAADADRLRALVDEFATPVTPCPAHTVAVESDRYVGLVRVGSRRRHARIGLVAVHPDRRRSGIARALLSHTLGALHRDGIETAAADVADTDIAATALFERLGARRAGSSLELVLR